MCHAAAPTQVDVGGPESRATLEADRALGHDGRVAVGPHQVVDLEQDLRPEKTRVSEVQGQRQTAGPTADHSRRHTDGSGRRPFCGLWSLC